MFQRLKVLLLASSCTGAALGCSPKIVDLGNNGSDQILGGKADTDAGNPNDTSRAVFRIVDNLDGNCGLVFNVRDGQLYWLTGVGASYAVLQLNRCDIEDCNSTLANLANVVVPTLGSCDYMTDALQIDGAFIYWAVNNGRWQHFLVQDTTGAQTSQIVVPENFQRVLPDSGRLYTATSDNLVETCLAADCGNSVVRFSNFPPVDLAEATWSRQVATADAEDLYLSEGNPSSDQSRLLRGPKSMLGPFTVVAEGTNSDNFSGVAISAANAYWLEPEITGQVKTCPISGCSGKPRILAQGFTQPTEIAVDESHIYVLESPQWAVIDPFATLPTSQLVHSGHVLRCPIDGCEAPDILFSSGDETVLSNLVLDDRFVYFSGRTVALDSGNVQSYIGAIQKNP